MVENGVGGVRSRVSEKPSANVVFLSPQHLADSDFEVFDALTAALLPRVKGQPRTTRATGNKADAAIDAAGPVRAAPWGKHERKRKTDSIKLAADAAVFTLRSAAPNPAVAVVASLRESDVCERSFGSVGSNHLARRLEKRPCLKQEVQIGLAGEPAVYYPRIRRGFRVAPSIARLLERDSGVSAATDAAVVVPNNDAESVRYAPLGQELG